RHASGLRHSEQNVQLMELESVHAVVALHDCDPYGLVIWTSKDSNSSTRPECTILRLGIALRAVGISFADRKERESSNEHHHYSEPCNRPVEASGLCVDGTGNRSAAAPNRHNWRDQRPPYPERYRT